MLKAALPIIKWLYLVSLAVFGVFVAIRLDVEPLVGLSFDPVWLTVSLLLTFSWVWWQSALWGQLLRDHSTKIAIDPVQRNRLFASAWLTRYLPGKVPGLASLAYQGTKLGVSRQKSSLVAVSQTVILALSMMLFASPAVWLLADLPNWFIIGFLATTFGLGAVLFFLSKETPALQMIRWLWKKLTGKKLDDTRAFRRKTVLDAVARSMVSSSLLGLTQASLLASIVPDMSFELFVIAIVVANMAVVAGIIAVIAPNGIGVREFVLFLGISSLTSPEVAAGWALSARLLTTVGDLSFWLGSWGVLRIRNFFKSNGSGTR